jgi:hypothetical protein
MRRDAAPGRPAPGLRCQPRRPDPLPPGGADSRPPARPAGRLSVAHSRRTRQRTHMGAHIRGQRTQNAHITGAPTWPRDGRWPVCGVNPLPFPARSIWRNRTHQLHARTRGDVIREPAGSTVCFRVWPRADRIGWQATRISRQAWNEVLRMFHARQTAQSCCSEPRRRIDRHAARVTCCATGNLDDRPVRAAATICAAGVRRAAVSVQHRSAARGTGSADARPAQPGNI